MGTLLTIFVAVLGIFIIAGIFWGLIQLASLLSIFFVPIFIVILIYIIYTLVKNRKMIKKMYEEGRHEKTKITKEVIHDDVVDVEYEEIDKSDKK